MVIGGEKHLGAVDAKLRAELMRRRSEEGLELANELEWRQLARSRDLTNGRRVLAKLSQQIARATQTSKEEIGEEHLPRDHNTRGLANARPHETVAPSGSAGQ
jgi:hypothetical protein